MDIDDKTYELPDRRTRSVPGDGERPRPAAPDDAEYLPEKKQPPAHKGLPKAAGIPSGMRREDGSSSPSHATESRRPEDDCYQLAGGAMALGDASAE